MSESFTTQEWEEHFIGGDYIVAACEPLRSGLR
jgi:hypothetical protein